MISASHHLLSSLGVVQRNVVQWGHHTQIVGSHASYVVCNRQEHGILGVLMGGPSGTKSCCHLAVSAVTNDAHSKCDTGCCYKLVSLGLGRLLWGTGCGLVGLWFPSLVISFTRKMQRRSPKHWEASRSLTKLHPIVAMQCNQRKANHNRNDGTTPSPLSNQPPPRATPSLPS